MELDVLHDVERQQDDAEENALDVAVEEYAALVKDISRTCRICNAMTLCEGVVAAALAYVMYGKHVSTTIGWLFFHAFIAAFVASFDWWGHGRALSAVRIQIISGLPAALSLVQLTVALAFAGCAVGYVHFEETSG